MCRGASSQSDKNTQFVYDKCKSFSCAWGLPDNPLRYHNGLFFRLHSDTSVLFLYWHICFNHFLQPSGFTAAEACFLTHATVHCLNPQLVTSLWTLPLLYPNWILPWKQTVFEAVDLVEDDSSSLMLQSTMKPTYLMIVIHEEFMRVRNVCNGKPRKSTLDCLSNSIS